MMPSYFLRPCVKTENPLSEVAKEELGPVAGFCTGLAMLFIITITMAGLSMVVLHALENNPWGTFAVGITIPIAMGVGLYHKKTGNLKGSDHRRVYAHHGRRFYLGQTFKEQHLGIY